MSYPKFIIKKTKATLKAFNFILIKMCNELGTGLHFGCVPAAHYYIDIQQRWNIKCNKNHKHNIQFYTSHYIIQF